MIEHVGFTMPVAATTVGHRHIVTDLAHRGFGLAYNELVILFLLLCAPRPLATAETCAYAMISRKTAFSLLSDMEDRGLIEKDCDPRDRRRMTMRLTSRGSRLVGGVLDALDTMWGTYLCENLPSREFATYMSLATINVSLDVLRGSHVDMPELDDCHEFYSVGHLVYWRALSGRWADVVRKTAGLTFTSFGILALLDDQGALSTSDIVDALMAQRSEVSVRTRQLAELGHVEVARDAADGRRTSVRITPSGRRVARDLKARLDEITLTVTAGRDDRTASIINVWYSRMYSNLRANWRSILARIATSAEVITIP